MTRDYKNVTEAGMKQKKGRAKSKNGASSEKNLPGWVWLVSGVVIGGFVSFILYLKLSVPVESAVANAGAVTVEKQFEKKAPTEKKPEATVAKSNSQSNDAKKPTENELEFYKVLTNSAPLFPNNKMADKAIDAESIEKTTEVVTAPVESKKEEAKPASSETRKSIKVSYSYVLQVGSFLAFKDADKRKANLAMLGVLSKIHSIKTRGVRRYRVMVGPYADIKRINKIEAEMKKNKIETFLIKERILKG